MAPKTFFLHTYGSQVQPRTSPKNASGSQECLRGLLRRAGPHLPAFGRPPPATYSEDSGSKAPKYTPNPGAEKGPKYAVFVYFRPQSRYYLDVWSL